MLLPKNIFYLAYRFLYNKHQHASIKMMVKVCAAGILIATCSLALIVSIMSGFEEATYIKMQSIYPDIIIDGQGQSFDPETITSFFETAPSYIKAYAPQKIGHSILTTSSTDQTIMCCLKGINPDQETKVSNIAQKITASCCTTNSLHDILSENKILIGCKLAENLNLTPNDPAVLLYQQNQQSSMVIIFDQQPVIIGGIFKTGIDDFDNNVIYCNAQLFDQMFDTHDISHIHVKLNDKNLELQAKNDLTTQLQAAVYSWKDLYTTLLSALKLEKWAMFLILLLVVCVASMNIISLIFMYVTQKQKDIFILMTLGLSYHKIRAVFITISLCITVPSTIIGLTLAWVIGLLLQTYPLIKLPDNMYDTQHIPVKLEPSIFCAILIITIIISLLTSLYATSNINRIKFIELLKT